VGGLGGGGFPLSEIDWPLLLPPYPLVTGSGGLTMISSILSGRFDMHNSELLIREMLNRADMRLQAQQTIALAADARAMQFVAACVAGAALIVTLGGDHLDWHHHAVAGMLTIAAICALWAARPLKWQAPGMQPSAFYDDISGNVPIAGVQMELSRHLEASIATNEEILGENANSLRLAAVFAVLAPVVGAIVAMAI
jgi:hypothetical protein